MNMDYEKYKNALERAKSAIKDCGDNKGRISMIESIFPELAESEDERIRKEIIKYIKGQKITPNHSIADEWIAWLEKQKSVSEIVERCKNSWYNEGKIAGMAEGLTDNEKYQQGWHDALEKQDEQKPIMNVPIREVILSIWDLGNEWKELTNGSISTEYGTQLDYIQKHWQESEYYLREKQGEQKPTDKVEPKFKVGDWIITKDKNVHKDYSICKIVEIENNRYHLENGDYLDIDTLEQYGYYLWTIDDAKDGDVLACGDKVYDCPFIFHNLTEKQNPRSYCGVNTLHHFQDNDENGGYWCNSDEVRPATKEQRDLLFAKMKEAGYQWNPDKKELKLLISNGGDFESNNSKQKPTEWSEDDERIITALMEGFRYHQLFNPRFGEVPNAEIISWIKSLKERLS